MRKRRADEKLLDKKKAALAKKNLKPLPIGKEKK